MTAEPVLAHAGHPDMCPYCRAPITVEQRKRLNELEKNQQCTCPIGFGQVVDAKCPRHGQRQPRHTVTGFLGA